MIENSQSELSLIRTKLAPPRIGSAPVARGALLDQLEARCDRKLSLVLGPAGSGKTMLLTQWRKRLIQRGATVAWYNVSADDDDVYIAAYIAESFRAAGLAISSDGLKLFARSGGKAWKLFLTSLINELGEHPSEIYFFIDDFQYIASFTILKLVDHWLALAPPRFHLAMASRIRPPIDLGRLRSEDQLTEIDFKDLRFSLDETREFAKVQGLDRLAQKQIGALHDITDGWAAGLQLLAFSLRKQRLPDDFLEGQARLSLAQEESLEHYLQRAALEHLSAAELSFLTRISACRRFNRELCELLTSDPQAATHLRKFEAENLFLLPIDTTDIEPWYRLHRLFANFLNKRLEKLGEPELQKLHQLASHWFAGKGLHREALRHARLASDMDLLMDLIDRVARRMIAGAEFTQLLAWYAIVPRERLRTRLDACLCTAWAQVSVGRTDEFERSLGDIALHPDSSHPDVRTEVELMKAYRFMRKDDTGSQLRIVEPMLSDAPPASAFQAVLAAYLAGIGRVYANRFEAARDAVRSRHGSGRGDHPKPFLEMIQGLSYLIQGHIDQAAELLASVLDDAVRTAALGADASGIIVGYLIEARFQQDRLDLARTLLDQHAELIDAVGAADSVLFSYRVRARLEQLDGNPEAAAKTLQRLEDFGYQEGADRLVAWSLYEQIRMALRAQRSLSVRELLQRLDLLAQRYEGKQNCAWAEIPLAALLARADIAFDESDDAVCLALLDQGDKAAAINGRHQLAARLGFMRAIILLRGGDSSQATLQARASLSAAAELGMRRLLLDIGSAAAALLGVLQSLELSTQEQTFLDAAVLAMTPAAPTVTEVAGVEVLSRREREVLELLSRALSTKSIARSLDLSAGTVKWHLKNIYGKLNAVSREDALAKARKLHILV
ncbi:LuxR C-terminal-related transcriptional regulator [Solimonas terrae]|uniref:HTH luxR-type domain-containing protein n=1 Tax=Solimonas terrae TaxID=1396819 RepID=A0A6M2BMD5_9GAMM|nr:LuxR C-terminal-related transcriptional regulator [Solimonas terrae]NGY03305.1 hypothetical protein [Solimonas terrae]